MVSMRYARMLAEGQGLAWNAGEPPVEGYTNLLWTLWMAIVHLLPLSDRFTSLAVAIAGAALVVLAAVVAARLAERLAPQPRGAAALCAALSVGLCYPLLYWSLRGMEVGLLALLVAAAVDLAIGIDAGEHSRVGALAAILCLTTLVRSDGIVPAAVIALAIAASLARRRPRTAAALVAAPFGVLALHTIFRLLYYGSPLPNTYYLKMTNVPAAIRIGRGAYALLLALPYVIVPLALTLANRAVYRRATTALLAIVPVTLGAYSVYVGGDAWEWMPHTNRYLTPALPLLLAGASATIASLAARARTPSAVRWPPAGALVLVALVSGRGFVDWAKTRGSHVVDDANKVWLGVRVRQTSQPGTRIAVVWAGAIPYFSHRPAIDFLGKSDPVIARHVPVTEFLPGHDRFDYDYSIGMLRPDLVVQLWFPPADLFQKLAAWGYEQVYGGVFVRQGAAVDVPRLRAAFEEPPIG